MTATVGSAPRRVLKARLRSLLWEMMALVVAHPDPKPLALSIVSAGVGIRAAVEPAGGGSFKGAEFPGTHFSPYEMTIWLALEAKPLNGKRIARAIGQPCTPKLRTILSNMVERGALTHDRAIGYSRAGKAASQ